MKPKIKQLKDGRWAAWSGNRYYPDTVRPTEREALIVRLQDIAREHQRKMDIAHRKLEELGAVDGGDPYGYLA